MKSINNTDLISWSDLINNHITSENIEHPTITLLHFKVENLSDKNLWAETLCDYFMAKGVYFLDNNYGVIVLSDIVYFDEEDFSSIMDIFDLDFSISSQFFMGLNHSISENLSDILRSEQSLFLKSESKERILYYTQEIINVSLKEATHQIKGLTLIKEIVTDTEIREMIQKLWSTNGNIAQSASELYIHRNTLIYRIEKFNRDTGLNLKRPHDLLICYLLTL